MSKFGRDVQSITGMNNPLLVPFDIQMFADGDPNDPEDNPDDGGDEDNDNEPTVEELMAELAQTRAEKEKLKSSLDKASSEAATYKKKFREKQTAEEQEEEAMREQREQHEKYVKDLEAKLGLIETTKRYMKLGMSEEFASETAKAELEGDSDAVIANMQKHQESLVKAKEAEWIKNRPDPNVGHEEDDDEKDPFLAGFNS